MIVVYLYPNLPPAVYIMFVSGFILLMANQKLENAYNKNKQDLEYDASGRRRGMEDYSAMSKWKRIEIDKQKLVAMERIVSSTAPRQTQRQSGAGTA